MLTSKGKIRLALFVVAFISLSTSFLSLSYMNRMATKIEVIAHKDAKMAELGETISIKMLEARREEKNFVIYFDSAYIVQNRKIIEEIKSDIQQAKEIARDNTQELDSVEVLIGLYTENIQLLARTLQEDPRTLSRLQRQVINYEEALKQLAQKQRLKMEDIPSWTSDLNFSLLSAAERVSSDKAKLFTELRETGNEIQNLAEEITLKARESLAKNSSEGMSYSIKAQRNTLILLLIAGCLLIYTIFYLPSKIFLPFRRIVRMLQAVGRDEDVPLQHTFAKDEFGELSRSFQEAIQKLKYFNELKTDKIVEIKRNFHRILEEVEEAVLILSSNLKISWANTAAKNLFSADGEMVAKQIKDLPGLREILGDSLSDIEKKGRSEFSIKLKKTDIRKKTVLIMPSISNTGKPDNILIVIK